MTAGNDRYWQAARQILTPRQLQILELHIRHGLTYWQIAYQLGLAPETVRGTIKRSAQKIELHLQTKEHA